MTGKTSIAVLVLLVLGHSPESAVAAERITAEVECSASEQQELDYECVIVVKGRQSGAPIPDAEFTVGADMPSMPGAHNIRPVPAEPASEPGTYRARIRLDMTGEWALKLDFTRPRRDRLIRKYHFGGSGAHGEHSH